MYRTQTPIDRQSGAFPSPYPVWPPRKIRAKRERDKAALQMAKLVTEDDDEVTVLLRTHERDEKWYLLCVLKP